MKIEENKKEEPSVVNPSTPSTFMVPPEIEKDDFKRFFDLVIMQEKPFTKEYKLGEVPIVFRTKSGIEAKETTGKIENVEKFTPTTIGLANDCNLAFSLVSIGDKKYDEGTLDQRLTIVENMPAPKKMLLWEYCNNFHEYVEKLRVSYRNF